MELTPNNIAIAIGAISGGLGILKVGFAGASFFASLKKDVERLTEQVGALTEHVTSLLEQGARSDARVAAVERRLDRLEDARE